MMREAFVYVPFLNLAIIGQLMFLSIFVGVLFWVFRKGADYSKLAQMPLDEGEKNGR